MMPRIPLLMLLLAAAIAGSHAAARFPRRSIEDAGVVLLRGEERTTELVTAVRSKHGAGVALPLGCNASFTHHRLSPCTRSLTGRPPTP